MSKVVSIKQQEELAIQDTLSMSEEQRIDLLANLIVDKIITDEREGGILLAYIAKDAA
jgi:hypothetical protein